MTQFGNLEEIVDFESHMVWSMEVIYVVNFLLLKELCCPESFFFLRKRTTVIIVKGLSITLWSTLDFNVCRFEKKCLNGSDIFDQTGLFIQTKKQLS